MLSTQSCSAGNLLRALPVHQLQWPLGLDPRGRRTSGILQSESRDPSLAAQADHRWCKESLRYSPPVFFCGHRTAIAVAEHFLGNLLGCFGFITVLAKFDEVRILGPHVRSSVPARGHPCCL